MILGWKKGSKKEDQAPKELPKDPWDLDDPLFFFSQNEKGENVDPFTPRTAMRGTLITGAIGSGKTSGSGDFFAMSFLKRGYGGLVLCGKVEEADEWIERAKRAGRGDDVVRFGEGSNLSFDPLLYQMSRSDEGGKRTETMTDLFMSLARINNRMRGGSGGGSSDPFWDMAPERLIKASLDILKLAKLDVTVENMVRMLTSVPNEKELPKKFERYCIERAFIEEEMKRGNESVKEVICRINEDGIELLTTHQDWDKNVLIQALRAIDNMVLSREDKGTYTVARQYFLLDLPSMGEKLKGSIQEVFYALANSMRGGLLDTYFAKGLSPEVMPEQTMDGKIIILDFPAHTYGYLGVFAQIIYKRSWQEALKRRDMKKHPRPVWLWIDEYQLFADPDDQEFCTTARSARVAPVFLTQNISNLYAAIGNRDRVISMLGNLVTKVFHQNGDYNTNEYATRTIGKAKRKKISGDLRSTSNADLSEILEDQVLPNEFTTLTMGGPKKEYIVEGIVTGDTYDGGKNFIKVKFRQHFAPKA